jgi:AcrR family transcriptional regulator
MPRPYRLGQRQATIEETRHRIIAAARDLLRTSDGYARFTVDHVAQQADVARKTVYYQFGSKIGLLEALCDALAREGGMEQLSSAFRQPEPLDALADYIRHFGRFWNVDRLTTRHLRGLATLDPEFALVVRARDERRREGLRIILQRLARKYGQPVPETLEETVDILYTLLSFETFDTFAGDRHSLEDVAPVIERLVRAVLHLDAA